VKISVWRYAELIELDPAYLNRPKPRTTPFGFVMKVFLRLVFLPLLLALGTVGAYLRGDFVALSILGAAFALWLLIVCLRKSQNRIPASVVTAKSKNMSAEGAENQLNDRVRWVASKFASDLSELRARAKTVAAELNPASIDQLASLFHSEHSPPPDIAGSFPALGQWIAARQFAIFEIFYFLGRPSIPTLKRVAFGKYDWTQGNAIEILCRLAADDLDREDIVYELIVHLPSIREEAHGYALGPLLSQAATNHALKKIIERLLVVPQFKESYEQAIVPVEVI
jgi:hypothetical protein